MCSPKFILVLTNMHEHMLICREPKRSQVSYSDIVAMDFLFPDVSVGGSLFLVCSIIVTVGAHEQSHSFPVFPI